MPLTLEADGVNVVKWWVEDASYAIHANMRSHTGGAMSLGNYKAETQYQKLN
jgi:hypothetical protein